jgi:hypothetical protein
VPIHIEAYTTGGILIGVVARPGHLREILEGWPELLVEESTWAPLDGSPVEEAPTRQVAIDDVVLASGDEEMVGPVHAAWHAIRLEAGPYVVEGELPTLPGFDPGRALTRPTGSFVLLRDVKLTLLGRPEAGENAHAQALINRYSVDRVDADIMLGFFFPGAHVPPEPGIGQAPTPEPPPGPENSGTRVRRTRTRVAASVPPLASDGAPVTG